MDIRRPHHADREQREQEEQAERPSPVDGQLHVDGPGDQQNGREDPEAARFRHRLVPLVQPGDPVRAGAADLKRRSAGSAGGRHDPPEDVRNADRGHEQHAEQHEEAEGEPGRKTQQHVDDAKRDERPKDQLEPPFLRQSVIPAIPARQAFGDRHVVFLRMLLRQLQRALVPAIRVHDHRRESRRDVSDQPESLAQTRQERRPRGVPAPEAPGKGPAWKRWRNDGTKATLAGSEPRVATRRVLGLTPNPLFPLGNGDGAAVPGCVNSPGQRAAAPGRTVCQFPLLGGGN